MAFSAKRCLAAKGGGHATTAKLTFEAGRQSRVETRVVSLAAVPTAACQAAGGAAPACYAARGLGFGAELPTSPSTISRRPTAPAQGRRTEIPRKG